MKYIDADLLRKKVEKLDIESCISEEWSGFYYAIDSVLELIDSLQQEQPEVFDTVAFQKGVQEGRRLERDEPVTDCHDLEEEYQEFCKDYPFPWSSQYLNREYIDELCLSVARHFAEWQKRKMMEVAVEGVVYRYESYQRIATAIIVDVPKESLGNKVKIIIVKED